MYPGIARSPRTALRPVIVALAVLLALYQIYSTAGVAIVDGMLQKVAHVSLVLALVYLWIPGRTWREDEREPLVFVLVDVGLALLALGVALFYHLHADTILERMRYVDPVAPAEAIFGVVTVLLVMEATRRTAGWPLVIVAACFIAYALFGRDLPGPLRHAGISAEGLVEQLFLLSDGIYGLPVAAAATMIYAFILFGAFLERTGMSGLFIDLACLVTRRAKGGPAKVSIFASALFGTISGSAPANVYGTGIFTIPLMKRVGYSAPFAAAVEACASTGGQLMPPIMGAAAFIMADVTGIGYVNVIKGALLPSILFYLSLWLMIHFEAVKKNLGAIPPEEVPPASRVFSRLYYLFPLAFLIGILLLGRSVNSAAFLGCVMVAALAAFRRETRIGPAALRDIAVSAARNTLMVSSCCACAGIVVGVMGITGGGFKFINLITTFVDGNLLLLLILLMLTCFIVGMGVPTAPAYIIVSVLAAPAMTKLGVTPLAANMFVLYYAVLSAITPPVCLAAFAGAAIADANAMRTGVEAVKLGSIAFIVPFFFVYAPALLLEGEPATIVQSIISSLVGVIALSAGLQRYFARPCSLFEAVLLVAAGLGLIYPGTLSDALGVGVVVLIGAGQRFRSVREARSELTT